MPPLPLCLSPDSRARAWAADAGGVLAAWLLFLALENVGVALAYRGLFAGPWEAATARLQVTPFAIAALLPFAFVAAGLGRAAGKRRYVEAVVGVAAMLTAYGVSSGRHMASWALRAPFLMVVTGAALGAAWWLVPRAARVGRVPLAVCGAAVALFAWSADAWILPRLYPAFHAALFAITLSGAALVSLGWRHTRFWQPGGGTMLVVGLCFVANAPFAARRIRSSDNMRIVLVEHAPGLGRAVMLAAWVAPPPPLDDAADVPAEARLNAARALDWAGRDVLLVSVDALRADHVSAYGYGRATTPNLDALAREGTLFEAAYCPTPHTSYSITSMMTGKYMRPLLALGLGLDSDTLATDVRRYGYRTAAFYPPAVFFIDEERFAGFRDRALGFEYAKVEFATPALRETQIGDYLASVPPDRPLLVWVHLFEPHEPYVRHPEHAFGTPGGLTDMDAYDSEIATADAGIGAIVARVRAVRPGIAIAVTADHGEEFGDHGGRYHGTTVYDEQVRVPLVVVGPGVAKGRVTVPVQTIDILPTVLSALDIPRPPRVRGRDLGPLLAGKGPPDDHGLAFAETEEYTLLARDAERLVCMRQTGACALFDTGADPHEQHDRSGQAAAKVQDLKRAALTIEREHGRFEAGESAALPEALRRGMQGEADAAEDVASLLDDADVLVRRLAAEVSYDLRVARVQPQLARGLKDEDPDVRRWCALAGVRVGDKPGTLALGLVSDPNPAWRRRAALALAEQGDARGETDLVAWFVDTNARDFTRARELLAALAKVHATQAVPSLVLALRDVRLRPFVADALGAIGSPMARAPLLSALTEERYVTARPHEARALLALGASAELRAPLARFMGLAEPMGEALSIARDAGLLRATNGGWSSPVAVPTADAALVVPRSARALRLIVLAVSPDSTTRGTANGRALSFRRPLPLGPSQENTLRMADLGSVQSTTIELHLDDAGGLLGAWIVAESDEVEPPAPADAGAAGAELR